MSALKSSPPANSRQPGSFRGVKRKASAACVAALVLAVSGSVGAQTPGTSQQSNPGLAVVNPPVSKPQQWAPGRLLVQPRPGLSDEEFAKVLQTHGGKSIGRIAGINVHIVQLPPSASEKAVAALLAKNPHIKFAELDMLASPDGTANDPYYASEWHLGKIAAPAAWDTSTGSGISVAVLDTGVDGTHPDLQGQLVPGWNFFDNNSNTADVYGHGTAVAGTVAAATNNGVGVAAIAYGAKVMPVRVSDLNGYAYWSTVAQALTWSADHGAKVANISYNGVAGSSTVQSAAQYLKGKGGETVVAASNNGIDEGWAASDTLIAVAATDGNDARASWSSYGNYVDLSAPGVSILTTVRGGGYGSWSGTSFSSPVVAATVALMMSANPALAPGKIEQLLFSTAQDLGTAGWDIYYGWGRVNAAGAVLAARSAVASDTTAPGVSLTAPTSGATVKGLVAINVSASDNVGVSRVDLVVNGSKLASDTASPYGFSWDSTTVPDGNATLIAYAYDAAGNYASSSVSITVANTVDSTPPAAAISNPGNGATVSGNVSIAASASDNVSVASMKLYIDGELRASGSGASLSYNWNSRKASAGTHTVKVEATDAAGNVGSQTISVVK